MGRPTPAQDRAVAYVAANPGCSRGAVALAVGPNGSTRYGYRTVNRALAAGRISLQQRDDGRWGCYLPTGGHHG